MNFNKGNVAHWKPNRRGHTGPRIKTWRKVRPKSPRSGLDCCVAGRLEEFFFSTAARFASCLNISCDRHAEWVRLGLPGSSYIPDYVFAEMDWLDACERLSFDRRRAYALYRLFQKWGKRHQGRNFPTEHHVSAILQYLQPDKAPSPPIEGGAA